LRLDLDGPPVLVRLVVGRSALSLLLDRPNGGLEVGEELWACALGTEVVDPVHCGRDWQRISADPVGLSLSSVR